MEFAFVFYLADDIRSRDCESTISIEYLRDLHRAYDEFLTEIAHVIPVIRVSWHRFHTAEEMAATIAEEYSSMLNIRHVELDSTPSPPTLPAH